MSTLKQTSDEYHQESSITIQHCSFFISTMDLYGHTLKEDGSGALSDVCEGVSSAPKRSTVIRFRIPQRRSTRLTPPALVPTVDKAYEMILQDTLQVSLAE
ncbi:hypothetical protein Tco_1068802 [Tanacetum coccineum]|uniref:Uncharacterized protein n=1 Tax=Tanacetum coccineum TaxID=301880 RepID=A0ABQ5HH57_9ASTR